MITQKVGDYIVSTVYVGLELFDQLGFSTLYETRIFPKEKGGENKYAPKAKYYGSALEAIDGHAKIVEALNSGKEPKMRERIQ